MPGNRSCGRWRGREARRSSLVAAGELEVGMRGWRMTYAAIVACALGCLAGTARAESGEYTGVVTLLAHGPEGANPLALATPLWNRSGTATLDVDLKGRVSGTLVTSGSAVPVTGTLRVNATTSKLTLKSSKTDGVSFRGFVSDHEVSGKISDKRGLLGGTGRLTIDLSNASSTTTPTRAAPRSTTRAARHCTSRSTGCFSTSEIEARSQASRRSAPPRRGANAGRHGQDKVLVEDAHAAAMRRSGTNVVAPRRVRRLMPTRACVESDRREAPSKTKEHPVSKTARRVLLLAAAAAAGVILARLFVPPDIHRQAVEQEQRHVEALRAAEARPTDGR
jgi:hypothetical protein